jgi:hypothetical protein
VAALAELMAVEVVEEAPLELVAFLVLAVLAVLVLLK